MAITFQSLLLPLHLCLSNALQLMSRIFYVFFTFLFRIAFAFVALFNAKARKGLMGRRTQNNKLKQKNIEKTIWMHCASLGEFEQGRPIAETLKKLHPHKKLIISFFSASGYEAVKNNTLADEVLYLPFDGKITSSKFIEYINPAIVIWVKYEYWYCYLTALKKNNIPVLLVSAHFRESQPFFKWYGGLHREMLSCFTQVFIQNDDDILLLEKLLPTTKYSVVGDTRFDRVLALKEKHEPLPTFIQDFIAQDFCIVAGSTWPEDELQLMHFTKSSKGVKFIIVPHEVDEDSIKEVEERFPTNIKYSNLQKSVTNDSESNILIVDTIGVLSRLYQYADIAYIGGGFNESGIHNSLEAAVWGTAIVFGPVYEKFAEAKELIEIDVATSVSTPIELDAIFNKIIGDKDILLAKKQKAAQFVQAKQGATDKIIHYVDEKRLLIS